MTMNNDDLNLSALSCGRSLVYTIGNDIKYCKISSVASIKNSIASD